MERRFINERQREGILRAKTGGVYLGGKRRLDREQIASMHAAGDSPAAIAKALGCSRMQVCRVLHKPRTGSVSALRTAPHLSLMCRCLASQWLLRLSSTARR